MNTKLEIDFYRQPTLTVAQELIGKEFVLKKNKSILSGIIVETEAYIGTDDPACHARFGKTGRNEIMFGDAGFTYVYFIYGMYNMLNFVTEPKGKAAAVLIRALQPTKGIKVMSKNRQKDNVKDLCSGPGKFCQAFGITVKNSGYNLINNKCYVQDINYHPVKISNSPRIGIKNGQEKLWRFFETDNMFISKAPKIKNESR